MDFLNPIFAGYTMIAQAKLPHSKGRCTMELSGVTKHILLCNGKSCIRKGAEDVTKAIRSEIKQQDLTKYFHTTVTLCNGRCEDGPTVVVYPEGDWYREMDSDSGRSLVQLLKNGKRINQSISYSFNEGEFVRFSANENCHESE